MLCASLTQRNSRMKKSVCRVLKAAKSFAPKTTVKENYRCFEIEWIMDVNKPKKKKKKKTESTDLNENDIKEN